jgi:hypothetical protein
MPRESTFCTIPLGIEISVQRGSITLLSMDIVVEKILKIGVSDLISIDIPFARLIVFGTMRNIFILKYWTRKGKIP